MKIIITQHQLNLINETYKRDRFDADYEDEYPKYKKLFLKTISKDVRSWGEAHNSIYLTDKKGNPLPTEQKEPAAAAEAPPPAASPTPAAPSATPAPNLETPRPARCSARTTRSGT